jgi:hypothetical protein
MDNRLNNNSLNKAQVANLHQVGKLKKEILQIIFRLFFPKNLYYFAG